MFRREMPLCSAAGIDEATKMKAGSAVTLVTPVEYTINFLVIVAVIAGFRARNRVAVFRENLERNGPGPHGHTAMTETD